MPGHKLQANMKTNNFRAKRNAKIRLGKTFRKLSDHTIDNKKCRQAKLLARKKERQISKIAFKASQKAGKMEVDDSE